MWALLSASPPDEDLVRRGLLRIHSHAAFVVPRRAAGGRGRLWDRWSGQGAVDTLEGEAAVSSSAGLIWFLVADCFWCLLVASLFSGCYALLATCCV